MSQVESDMIYKQAAPLVTKVQSIVAMVSKQL